MDILPFVKCVCPACFEEIYLGECAIVSGVRTEKSKDKSGQSIDKNIELKPMSRGPFARMKVESLEGRKYTIEKARRACTECGYLLPHNIESVPGVTLAIVGDVHSGKTLFIAAFIRQLQDWLGTNVIGSFECLTPDVEKKYTKGVFEPLFNNGQPADPTPPLPLIPGTRVQLQPLIYNLSIGSSPRRPSTEINLMIYDSGGEGYESTDLLVQVNQFVFNTNALIFVVDPYKFTDGQSNVAASSITKIVNIFKRYHKASYGASFAKIPIAVMVSKADLFNSVFPINQFAFMTDPHYTDKLDLADSNTVDSEVQNLLLSYKQSGILAATGDFKHRRFFATSTTGEPLDPVSGRFEHVNPRRCLDPILWILHELSVIRGY